jgi:hypothetical protein
MGASNAGQTDCNFSRIHPPQKTNSNVAKFSFNVDTRFPFMCRIGTNKLLIHSLELELDGSS